MTAPPDDGSLIITRKDDDHYVFAFIRGVDFDLHAEGTPEEILDQGSGVCDIQRLFRTARKR